MTNLIIEFKESLIDKINPKILAYFFLILFSYAVFYIGFKYHIIPVELPDTPERDFYSRGIKAFHEGIIVTDPWRPKAYVVFSQIFYLFTADAFTAGRLLSNVSALLTLYVLFLFITQITSAYIALFSIIFFSFQFTFQEIANTVSSDCFFNMLYISSLYSMFKFCEKKTLFRLIRCSFLCSMTYFTRYTGSILFLIFFISLFLTSDFKIETMSLENLKIIMKKIPKHVIYPISIFFLFSFIFLIPHMYLSYKQFNKPFFNSNCVNTFVSKVVPGSGMLESTVFAQFDEGKSFCEGYVDLFKNHFFIIIKNSIKEALRFLVIYLPKEFNIENRILSLLLTSILMIMSLYVFKKLEKARIWFLSVFIFLCGIFVTFYAKGRIISLSIPFFIFVCIYSFFQIYKKMTLSHGKNIILVFSGFLGILWTFSHWQEFYKHFILRHPIYELEALKDIVKNKKDNEILSIMGTSPFMPDLVPHYTYFTLACSDYNNPQNLIEKLKVLKEKNKASHIVLGKMSIYCDTQELFKNPYGLSIPVAFHSSEVIVYKLL